MVFHFPPQGTSRSSGEAAVRSRVGGGLALPSGATPPCPVAGVTLRPGPARAVAGPADPPAPHGQQLQTCSAAPSTLGLWQPRLQAAKTWLLAGAPRTPGGSQTDAGFGTAGPPRPTALGAPTRASQNPNSWFSRVPAFPAPSQLPCPRRKRPPRDGQKGGLSWTLCPGHGARHLNLSRHTSKPGAGDPDRRPRARLRWPA